jgi:hypothetical protein
MPCVEELPFSTSVKWRRCAAPSPAALRAGRAALPGRPGVARRAEAALSFRQPSSLTHGRSDCLAYMLDRSRRRAAH